MSLVVFVNAEGGMVDAQEIPELADPALMQLLLEFFGYL